MKAISGLRNLMLRVVQLLTSRIQIKGMARALWAAKSYLRDDSDTYRVYNNIAFQIDSRALYQWWNVVNYAGFEIVLLLERLLKKGDVYVDVGANIGFMAINAAKIVGREGHVLAVEPEPRVRAKLIRNVELNRMDNIAIIPKALGDKSGTASFNVATEEGLSRLDYGRDNPCMELLEKIEVPLTTLDGLIEDFAPGQRVRLVKMDIEGSEYSVLLGARKLLARGETIFIFESNWGALEQNGLSLIDISKLLSQENYELFAINPHSADWFRIGRFPSFQQIVDPSVYAKSNLDVLALPRTLCGSLQDILRFRSSPS